MTPIRAVLLSSLLGLLVAVSFMRTSEQFQDSDAKHALNIAKTTRFADQNDARIDVWLAETDPGAKMRWRPMARSMLQASVPISLVFEKGMDSKSYPFEVRLETRTLTPSNADSRRLVEEVSRWAEARRK